MCVSPLPEPKLIESLWWCNWFSKYADWSSQGEKRLNWLEEYQESKVNISESVHIFSGKFNETENHVKTKSSGHPVYLYDQRVTVWLDEADWHKTPTKYT